MKLLKLCYSALLMVFSTVAISQSSGFLSYSVSDGLAQSNVIDIVEDDLGNLWLATSAGLSKFDGHGFENFTKKDGLLDNQISSLAIDDKGRIWIGTDCGLSYFNGYDFTEFDLGLGTNEHSIKDIFVDSQHQIWFTTSGKGLYYISNFDQVHRVPYFDNFTVTDLLESHGSIWITVDNERLFKHQPGASQELGRYPDNEEKRTKTIFFDRNENIWLGASSGLYRWQNNEFVLIHPWPKNSGSLDVFSIDDDSKGTLWIGTSKGGFRFDGKFCHALNASNGFIDNIVYKVYLDREDNVWFGTFGSGLYKSLGTTFYSLGRDNGITYDYVSAISKDSRDSYWFGTYGGGLYKYQPADTGKSNFQITNLTIEDGLSSNFIFSSLIDHNDDLWLGTENGLNQHTQDGFREYTVKDGLPSNIIFATHKGFNGDIAIGTSKGLVIRKEGKFENYFYENGSVEDNRVRTIESSTDGHLWLGTRGGLKIFDGKLIHDGIEDSVYKNLGISAIHQDQRSNLWLGLVDGGILRYDLNTKQVTQFGQEDGLTSSIIYAIVSDHEEQLWLGTNHGLDRLTFSDSGTLIKVKSYGKQEGFGGIEVNTNAVFLEDDGSIWFGTVQGVYHCIPKNEKINSLEPITSIHGIDLFSKEVNWSDRTDSTYSTFRLPYNPKLDHNENHLTFHFLGNSLKNPARVRYQYILENFDKDWLPVTDKMEAVYTNLPPGNYNFKVKACNNEGVWNTKPTAFAFSIKSPFWRTWWFYSLLVAGAVIFGRVYYRAKVTKQLDLLLQTEKIKQQEMEKVRKQLASDFHDQVGNQLASITVLVQLIKAHLKESNQEIQELLIKLGHFSKSLFTGTKDFVWSIDPRSDYIDKMLIYIRDFGEELFEFSDINFHVDSRDSFDQKIALPLGWSRHVVFILKEGLTNCLKHAKCQNVYLNFDVNPESFVLELRDDGQGLNGNAKEKHQGIGLQNMRVRAKKINSKISISSNNGSGTIIVLKGKIPLYGG